MKIVFKGQDCYSEYCSKCNQHFYSWNANQVVCVDCQAKLKKVSFDLERFLEKKELVKL
jgi:hypothetical protein